jgi:hypothetical protein
MSSCAARRTSSGWLRSRCTSAQLFLVRFNQLNIADIKRCGERIAGTINNTAQSMLLSVFDQLRQVIDADAGRQTSANHQQRTGGDGENFFLKEAELLPVNAAPGITKRYCSPLAFTCT